MGRRKKQSTIDRRKATIETWLAKENRDATPEAIAERERIKAEIQAEWDDFTRASRWVNKVRPVEVPRGRFGE